MYRREFLSLLTLAACSEEMILPQQIANLKSVGGTPQLMIVAGQSNAEKGQLHSAIDLLAPYIGPFPEVQYYGADSNFHSLARTNENFYHAPVDGTDVYANQFYLYPAIAAALGCTASKPLYVCSQSVGDTELATDWLPPSGTQYVAFKNRIIAAKNVISILRGRRPEVIFCLFDQGEKDGRDTTKSTNYGTNLNTFINTLRTDISEPGLRFIFPLIKMGAIIGTPNPVDFGSTVNAHKITLAAANPTTILTQDSNFYEPSTDGVHFTVAGQTGKNNGLGSAGSGTPGALRMSQLQVLINAGWIPGTPSSAVPTNETYFNGTANYVRFGDILDSLFAAASASFRLGLTVWNPPAYGSRTLVSKFATTGNQRCFHWFLNGTTAITFNYYMNVGTGAQVRSVSYTYPSTLTDGNEHTLELRYDGSINTNDGLDRISFFYDGSLYTTGKTLASSIGALTNTLFNSTAQLAVAAIVANGGLRDSLNFIGGGWAREFFVQNGSGTDQVRVTNLGTGTDSSGNGNNGTYV